MLSCLLLPYSRLKKLIRREEEKSKRAEAAKAAQDEKGKAMTAKEPEGYAECYPGMSEMNDAIDDSDDEVDYSKMDLVSKRNRLKPTMSVRMSAVRDLTSCRTFAKS